MSRAAVLVAVTLSVSVSCAPPPGKDCGARGPGVDLSGCDLRGVGFAGMPLPDDFGQYVTLEMGGANFDGALLDGASFGPAVDLDGATFRRARLVDARFAEDAGVFNTVQLDRLVATDADLTGVDVDGTALGGDFSRSVLRNLWVIEGGFFGTFVDADLSGSTFRDFSGIWGDLRGADLRATNFWFSSVSGDLRGADLRGALFAGGADGPSVVAGNLRGADLAGARFERGGILNADLNGASLVGAAFSDTEFRNVDLTDADLTGAVFSTSSPNSFIDVVWSNTRCPDGVVRSTPCF
jgi:uncharacterized protein YjbI with pentapeptide repeats